MTRYLILLLVCLVGCKHKEPPKDLRSADQFCHDFLSPIVALDIADYNKTHLQHEVEITCVEQHTGTRFYTEDIPFQPGNELPIKSPKIDGLQCFQNTATKTITCYQPSGWSKKP
jgi:hypothetical protein